MKNKVLLIGIGIFISVIVVIVAALFIFSKALDSSKTTGNNTSQITEKPMKGIAGFSPANFPNSSIFETKAFINDVNKYSNLFSVHTNWKDMKIVDVCLKEMDVQLNLVIGFQDHDDWVNNTDEYIETVSSYITKSDNIIALSVGNEINSEYIKDPVKFEDFIKAYKTIYAELKKRHPKLKVYTTFQYETLKGNGFLTGKVGNNNLELITRLEDSLDFIGLTVYPFFDYEDPGKIPDEYFFEIKNLSKKPIVITETSWPGGEMDPRLTQIGFTGSEDAQVKYLERIISIAKKDEIEFVNWFMMNDFTFNENQVIFRYSGLKSSDGSPRKVWESWMKFFVK
jgi:exo-beta-1,3-glucanase (GH17 family)